jgi:hypothetical protein
MSTEKIDSLDANFTVTDREANEARLTAYALDRSPLLARFVVPGVAPELPEQAE